MTRKLFYENPYITEFETSTVEAGHDEAERPYVVLEETAFYPTGGGQPFDKGTLNGIGVVDVEEVQGQVRHYVAEPLGETSSIKGEVDWKRRFDHMQQHTGQHMLSAVMHDGYGFETLSFHLGKEIVSIDLHTESLSEATMIEAEQKVNAIIQDNLPIETEWMSAEEANQFPLRKPLAVEEDVRLVTIPEVDYNGCGGTHPYSTGEVMAVKLLGWSRHKQHIRLDFVCGYRVLEQLHQKHHVLQGIKHELKRPEEGLDQEVADLVKENKQKDKQIADLTAQLLEYEAKDLMVDGSDVNGTRVVQKIYKDRSIKTLQSLAKGAVEQSSNALIVLVSEQAEQLQFVLAQGEEVPGNMKEAAQQAMPLIEGKGGGKPNFVQGGGTKALTPAEFAERLQEAALQTIQ